MTMNTPRMPRIEELIKEELADIIQKDLTDPRVGFATISRVRVAKDLRQAIVGVSVLSDNAEEIAQTLEGLNHAKGFLRRELSARVKMKYLPELRFLHDGSTAYALHIQEVLNQIADEGHGEVEDGELV